MKDKKYCPYGDKKYQKLIIALKEIARALLFVDDCNCLICKEEYDNSISDLGLCEKCLGKLVLNNKNICHKCGRVLENEAEYCNTCQNRDRYFDFARSSCVYEQSAVALVHGLKFGSKAYYARYMARLMLDKYIECNFDCDCIVAVPLSDKRKKKRGYNQADLLARELSRKLKLDYMQGALIKTVDTPMQAKLGTLQREENLKGAYKVVDKDAFKGRKVLLIDDVLTTGATASEVSKILYKAKAKRVSVLTFASTRYKVPTENTDKGEKV